MHLVFCCIAPVITLAGAHPLCNRAIVLLMVTRASMIYACCVTEHSSSMANAALAKRSADQGWALRAKTPC